MRRNYGFKIERIKIYVCLCPKIRMTYIVLSSNLKIDAHNRIFPQAIKCLNKRAEVKTQAYFKPDENWMENHLQ